jgi:dipeptidyl aminopeptidase/acylaminoacyl peptidase
MREDDLLRMVWLADPQISPDGSKVAFTRVWIDVEADEYRTQIWIADAEGGGASRPLSAGLEDSQPRWSPDGLRLAFVRKRENAKGQIHVLPMSGGEAVAFTALEHGASDPAWSPDGRRIAFLSGHDPILDAADRKKPKKEPARIVTKPVFRENDLGFLDPEHRDQVWVVEAEGGAPRRLTLGPYAAQLVRWSRNGERIFFVSDRRAEPWFGTDQAKLYAVSPDLENPTDGPALELVVDMPGSIGAYVEAQDGSIAMIGTESREPSTYDQPGLFVARGPWPRREIRRLARSYDFPFGEALMSDQHPPRGGGECPFAIGPDGSVFARAGRHGSSLLVRVRDDEVTELTGLGQDLVAGTVAADGSRWALVIANPRSPCELALFDRNTLAIRTLDAPNREWLSEVALGEIEELWYESFDGRRVQAWIMTPPASAGASSEAETHGGNDARPQGDGAPGPGATPRPLVLEIHGGPHTAYGYGFFHEFHVLAGAGYVVLYTNPRGSTTYGEEFAQLIQYRFPDEDAKDLLAAVDAVLARGGVDAARLGVTGGSGGGLLTNWLIVQSDRFAAAVTQRCVSDWASFYYSADFAMFAPFWFRRPPFEDPEEYRLRSPIAFASQVKTPLMVIHSEEDWRTPIGQGEAMFRALLQQRKPSVMVRFPGESHELSRSGAPSHRVQNQQHIRLWFDRWLMGKPAPEYGF